MKAREVHDAGSDAHHRVRARRLRVARPAVERMVARLVEHIAEFLDLAPHQGLQGSGDPAHRAHRIGDVAEHELARLIARIHVAVEFLCVARAGEGRRSRLSADAGPDEQELGIAAETAQLRGDADDSVHALALRLRPHPLERGFASRVNHARDVGNLAPDDSAERRTHPAEKSHRLDAVADDHAARGQSLEPHAVDLVAREAGQSGFNPHHGVRSTLREYSST